MKFPQEFIILWFLILISMRENDCNPNPGAPQVPFDRPDSNIDVKDINSEEGEYIISIPCKLQ